MANLMSYETHGKDSAPWLKATMAVMSPFRWNLEVLKCQIAAGLARENKWPIFSCVESDRAHFWRVQLTIEAITDVNYPPGYLISWSFEPDKLFSGYDAEKMQSVADVILAVFNEMEEKVRSRRAFDEPLSWLVTWQPVPPGQEGQAVGDD